MQYTLWLRCKANQALLYGKPTPPENDLVQSQHHFHYAVKNAVKGEKKTPFLHRNVQKLRRFLRRNEVLKVCV